jgi:hypothetical protein
MALTYEFLMARANEASQEAEGAVLDNVRRRALRSEAAWRDMALRQRKIEHDRETARRLRASQVAAQAMHDDALDEADDPHG